MHDVGGDKGIVPMRLVCRGGFRWSVTYLGGSEGVTLEHFRDRNEVYLKLKSGYRANR